jgi:hypothetical protein
MEEIAADPTRALDLNLDIFGPVAAQVPEFKEWRDELMQTKVTAADGETEYFLTQEVLKRVRTPQPDSGEELARPFMLKVLKAQARRSVLRRSSTTSGWRSRTS